MPSTTHFWNNLDLNTDYLTGVLSVTGKVRKWFGAGAFLSAASQPVFLHWGAQKGSLCQWCLQRKNLLWELQTVLNQLLKNQLPLGGRLFVLFAPHLFPHLSESGTWKPLSFDCTPMSLRKAHALHQQFTLQRPSSLSDFLKVYFADLSEKSNC